MKSRYRIVYCEGNVDGTIGGSYFSLLFLVAGLDREQFEPVVVFRREHALMDRFRDTGVEVVVIPPEEPVSFGLARDAAQYPAWLRPLILLRQGVNFLKVFAWDAIKLAWWLRSRKADLVHLNNSVTRTHSWMLAAKLVGVPCVCHERGMNTQYSRMSRYFAPRLARVICISNAVRDNLVEHKVSSRNLVVIYNGIDPNGFRPVRSGEDLKQELKISPDVTVIGMVGNVRPWKGQDVVVKAMGRLVAGRARIVCIFVGEATAGDASYLQHLRQLAENLSAESHLRFVGYQKNVADYVNVMDVVIHASVDPEPFGRVLIEAMSLGKPVIGANAGAVPEILEHPNCGLTFEPGNDEELARLIESLLRRPDLMARIGEAARSRVKVHFGIWQNIRATESVYLTELRQDNWQI